MNFFLCILKYSKQNVISAWIIIRIHSGQHNRRRGYFGRQGVQCDSTSKESLAFRVSSGVDHSDDFEEGSWDGKKIRGTDKYVDIKVGGRVACWRYNNWHGGWFGKQWKAKSKIKERQKR
jgi:hypothetical protein